MNTTTENSHLADSFAQQSSYWEDPLRIPHARSVLLFAIITGIAGTFLLRGHEAGVNVALIVGAFSVTGSYLLKKAGNLDARTVGLLSISTVLAVFFAWRTSPFLQSLALAGVIVPLALAVVDARAVHLWRLSISDHIVRLFSLFCNAVGGIFPLVFRDVEWKSSSGTTRHLISVLCGIALALPFLVIFGLLFRSADIHFEALVDRLFVFDAEILISHVLWVTVLTCISGGWFRRMMFATPPPQFSGTRKHAAGSIELTVAVAMLNLLFLAFVLVQVRYFFGGDSVVQLTPGLTYAEYARRGFFELVTAAGLVLPLLLVADWLFPACARATWFRAGCASLIALLFVIMLSAAKRMQLYQAEYGLTELRFYVSAFMILLFALFLWFGATVLRGQRNLFATGALGLALLSITALHAVNPDAWIMRVNLRRLAEGKPFDATYAARHLSLDAYPTLLRNLDQMPAEVRDQVIAALPKPFFPEAWQSWNWSRHRAASALRNSGEFVRAQTPVSVND